MATRRPDLEAAPYKAPAFISNLIAPPITVGIKSSTFAYADIQADVSAQTGRSAGAAPTTGTLTESTTTYTCAEAIRRENIDDAARAMFGGLAKAEMVKARLCKRALGAAVEAVTAANVLAQASPGGSVDILASLVSAIDTGVNVIQDKGAMGRIALVASRRILNRIKRYSEVIDRMKYTGVVQGDVRSVRGVSDEQLAGALDVDVVLGGPDAQWYTASATYQDRAALIVLPDPNADVLEEVQFGRTFVYPVGDQASELILVESYHDDNLVADVVQARTWYNQVIVNPELVYILKGIDEGNANTTTTSTTT